jgi:hypothetical protein
MDNVNAWRGFYLTQLGANTSGAQNRESLEVEWCRRYVLNGMTIDANGSITQTDVSFTTNAVTANVVTANTLTVTGTAALGNTTVTGFVNVSTTLQVAGISTHTGNTTFGGYINVSSTLQVAGLSTLTGNTTLSGFANVAGALQVTGLSTLTGNTTIGGNCGVTQTVSGNVIFAGAITGSTTAGDMSASRSANTGALFLGSDGAGYIFRSNSSLITIPINLAAQNANFGTLQASGNTLIQGYLNATSTLQVAGLSTLTGNATLSGFANVVGSLQVTGLTTLSGNTVIQFPSTLAVAGLTTLTGNASLSGFANISTTLQVAGATIHNGLTTANAGLTVNGTLTIGGGTGNTGQFLGGGSVWVPLVQTNNTTGTGAQTIALTQSGTGDLVLFCNNATLLTVWGVNPLGAAVDGQLLTIYSTGAGQVDLLHQSASATASYRLVNIATSGPTSLAPGTGVAVYRYDLTLLRWRLVAHEQGAWITPTFAAGNYTGSASMTWTVASGNISVNRYKLVGRTLHINWYIASTSVGGTPNAILQMNIPGGYTAAGVSTGTNNYNDNGSGYAQGFTYITGAAATFVSLYKTGFGTSNWSASAGATITGGGLTFEVQ